jgi:hypothetical protein
MAIQIEGIEKKETAYDKHIHFVYQDIKYYVVIHWDDHDGYEATWLDNENRFISTPDWAEDIHDLYGTLDLAKAHTEVSL